MESIQEMEKEELKPVIISNQEGNVTFINKCFKETFGYSEDDLIGKALTTIIPKEMHMGHNMGVSRFIASGKPKMMNKYLNLKIIDKNGSQVNTEQYMIAEKKDDKWVFGATITPA